MSEFRYSEAERCLHCDLRVIVPTESDAEALVRHSGSRLAATRCPAEHGWHLNYPAVEDAPRK